MTRAERIAQLREQRKIAIDMGYGFTVMALNETIFQLELAEKKKQLTDADKAKRA